MNIVRCLYFEDEDDQRIRHSKWIRDAWNNLKTGADIEIAAIGKIEEAEEKIDAAKEYLAEQENQHLLHLFIADIKVKEEGREEQNLGLGLIARARKALPDLAILGLSIESGLRDDAIQKGADDFIWKRILAEGNLEKLGELMHEALVKHQHQPSLLLDDIIYTEGDDLRLESLIEIIGRINVSNFVLRFVKRTGINKICPSYVRSGLSGASVLSVAAHYHDSDTHSKTEQVGVEEVLLKISKDRIALSDELRRFDQETIKFPRGIFVRSKQSDSQQPANSGGWNAISYEYLPDAMTLIDWLIRVPKNNDDVESLMNGLFLNEDRGLKKIYQNIVTKPTERPNVGFWNLLTPSRKTRILETLIEEKFGELAEKFIGGKFNKEIITSFLSSKRIDRLNEEDVKMGAVYCLSHGDLHGRNILVSRAKTAYLIDPACIGLQPWVADIARLSVDILVSAWRAGTESYEWDKVKEWEDLVYRFIDNDLDNYKIRDTGDESAFAALVWIRKNLSNIHPVAIEREWEFQLACAIELLRSSYRLELPAPKRVLGMATSSEAIKRACHNYPRE